MPPDRDGTGTNEPSRPEPILSSLGSQYRPQAQLKLQTCRHLRGKRGHAFHARICARERPHDHSPVLRSDDLGLPPQLLRRELFQLQALLYLVQGCPATPQRNDRNQLLEVPQHPVEEAGRVFPSGIEFLQSTKGLSPLSPGERTRAALALLQARGVNVLVLDEPTNHLDLPAIEQLESALASYDGALLLVTHDRRMLANVNVDRRWHVEDGRVQEL